MPGFLPGKNSELTTVCHFEPLSRSQFVMRRSVMNTQPKAGQVQVERARDFKQVSWGLNPGCVSPGPCELRWWYPGVFGGLLEADCLGPSFSCSPFPGMGDPGQVTRACLSFHICRWGCILEMSKG